MDTLSPGWGMRGIASLEQSSWRPFQDRTHAGALLAEELAPLVGMSLHLLAIPRGGVEVASRIRELLNIPMDLIIPKKIPAPGQPELAIGAMLDRETVWLDQDLIDLLDVEEEYLKEAIDQGEAEIDRRRSAYGVGELPSLQGKVAVVVDDGMATGSTMKAAVQGVKKKLP